VTWLITGDMIEGMNLSIITIFTKLIWYYFHEHFWFKSSLKNTNKRHVFKTFTWRVIGTLDTILFGWLMTGNPLTGLKIGGIETASKMLLYFGHEKFWYKINYGLDTQNRPRQLKNLQTKIKVRK
jgi:uncharacterized membrane protein